MFAPTYLNEADRSRLVEINQKLLSGTTGEEYDSLVNERNEIFKRQKNISDCNYEELQDLKKQLYELYQKHASIRSSQTRIIASFIQQVEFRSALVLEKQSKEPTQEQVDDNDPFTRRKPSKNKVSSKRPKHSWSVDFSKHD